MRNDYMVFGSTFVVRVPSLDGDAVCGGDTSVARVRLYQTSRGGKAVEDFTGEFGEEDLNGGH